MQANKPKPTRKRAAGAARATAPHPPARKTAGTKPATKDPVSRYMQDHWGALGKDYKLEY